MLMYNEIVTDPAKMYYCHVAEDFMAVSYHVVHY